MEYQKIINLLNNTPYQPYEFRTKNYLKTLTLSSNLCNYSDVYILLKGNVIFARGADAA